RSRRVFSIRGNHDHFIAHGHGKVAMSQTARAAAEWTRARLSDPDRQWLGKLPLKHQDDTLLAVHGAPVDRSYFNGYVYETTWERNLDWMLEHRVRLCLHGHSHVQGGWCAGVDGARAEIPAPGAAPLDGLAHLVNPGAVGQPRNRRPGAQAAILDWPKRRITFLQIDYDIERVAHAIRTAGLPEALAGRLIEGR
ncbi:MAG: metallophosphoesterase family protein, partial [Mariprofundaceae bacterium]